MRWGGFALVAGAFLVVFGLGGQRLIFGVWMRPIEADLQAVQENGKMLTKMEGFLGVTTVQATEKGALNAEQAIALAKHIRDSRLDAAK